MDLIIKVDPHNKLCYQDILKDILKRKNGVFTFTLRVNKGQIVDYVTMEIVKAKKINGVRRSNS